MGFVLVKISFVLLNVSIGSSLISLSTKEIGIIDGFVIFFRGLTKVSKTNSEIL